jgi:DNA-binding Xre family transcriptional regulator
MKGVRFDTLEKICGILDWRSGDFLECRPEETK